MGQMFIVEDGLIICHDYSFTVTTAAALRVVKVLLMNPPPPDIPDWMAETAVFGLLCKAEGYSREVTTALASNDDYAQIVQLLWETFKESQAPND
ncbi:hypothetical protein [Arthrobacter sp. HY1533]|uniref:hypothetical protein n=1 Tax=Arthrobacter sp. HY1533 TaxID=2970919 RepID=UPI0022B9E7B0|nr:hypothetical protein [Arthrobacter sp. HY1533]